MVNKNIKKALSAVISSVILLSSASCSSTSFDTVNSYISEGKYKEAVTELEKYVSENPKDKDGWIKLSEAYYENGDIDNAISVLNRALEKISSEIISERLSKLKKERAEKKVSDNNVTETTVSATEPPETITDATADTDANDAEISTNVNVGDRFAIASQNDNLIWKSYNPYVAAVDGYGNVTINHDGAAVIIGKNGDYEEYYSVSTFSDEFSKEISGAIENGQFGSFCDSAHIINLDNFDNMILIENSDSTSNIVFGDYDHTDEYKFVMITDDEDRFKTSNSYSKNVYVDGETFNGRILENCSTSFEPGSIYSIGEHVEINGEIVISGRLDMSSYYEAGFDDPSYNININLNDYGLPFGDYNGNSISVYVPDNLRTAIDNYINSGCNGEAVVVFDKFIHNHIDYFFHRSLNLVSFTLIGGENERQSNYSEEELKNLINGTWEYRYINDLTLKEHYSENESTFSILGFNGYEDLSEQIIIDTENMTCSVTHFSGPLKAYYSGTIEEITDDGFSFYIDTLDSADESLTLVNHWISFTYSFEENMLLLYDGINNIYKYVKIDNGQQSYIEPAYHSVNIGDVITFGKYEQDNDLSNGAEDIEWRVLDIEGGKALLITEYAIDCQKYNDGDFRMTWENCTLRTWLNDDFLNAAFSSKEQKRILTTYVTADNNPDYNTSPGRDTNDQIFLLSVADAEKYFENEESRIRETTPYAEAHAPDHVKQKRPTIYWWLRNPGSSNNRAANVTSNGKCYMSGSLVYERRGVVPAIWINID